MFRKLLVANRGEVAVRVLRTCKRLGIATVAVHSDVEANALHARSADERICLGGARLAESYLNVDALLAAIQGSGADAVHPGYGLLSEDPAFARAVRALGVTFVGPRESALDVFGDKVASRKLAQAQGLPLAPGTEQPVDPTDEHGLRQAASAVGYPIVIKAAAGGGGIGMQIVRSESELASAVESCRSLGQRAFGDARVYFERLLRRPRHIEVQVIADHHGNVRAIGDRECSVQRRHQKVLEEAPSPAAFLTQSVRQELYARAERVIAAAGCSGLSTVEFIADSELEPPVLYFLEVNARLQVEHPVTEQLTGLDLVELQLAVAAGQALPSHALGPTRAGHAIEARLYAEDPGKKFMPQPGQLVSLELPQGAGIRVDSGYVSGDVVTPHYDPLIAKIITFGADRAQALARMRSALAAATVQLVGPKGPRATNLSFLRRVVEAPAFSSGEYDTHLLDDLIVPG